MNIDIGRYSKYVTLSLKVDNMEREKEFLDKDEASYLLEHLEDVTNDLKSCIEDIEEIENLEKIRNSHK